ncbi:MAG: formate C-acetyltransferase/glycerol dehydratase family glycyl radical enzyme, partial [Planctomycetes bacterium]|nr:formate C-acetyltransferase/glycerol dehydratase family glycyl radical enzyme [Planctomycetota bacterium]
MSDKRYLPEGMDRIERTEFLNRRMRSQKPAISIERARLVTESDRLTVGEPVMIRRSKALRHVLANMRVYILDEELIAGHHADQLRHAPMFPETAAFSAEELDLCPIRKVDTLQISKQDRDFLLNEIYPYWRGKTQADAAAHYFPPELKKELSCENKVFNPVSRTRSGYGHYTPDFPTILEIGFAWVRQQAAEALARLSEFDPDYARKLHFYQSVDIIAEGVDIFARRHAEVAEEMAKAERDGRRRRELELIASACRQVPYRPARTYHEALQSYWFTLLIDYIGQNGSAISAGRFDQYIYPFYRRDIEAGRIAREDALELVEALLVQHLDIIKAGAFESVRNNGGFATTIHMGLSGLDRDGNDATNEFSYMVLEADKRVFNSEPNIGLRVSSKTPDAIIEKLLENLVHCEGGKYPIFNDDAIVPALERDGVSPEDAFDYSVVGCVEPTPSGNTMGLTNACFFNVAKCLELALNNGVCMLSGEQMGPRTGESASLGSYDAVWNAFAVQLEYFARRTTLAMNMIIAAIAERAPHVYCSLVTKGCMEKGLDSAAGAAKYNYVGIQAVGIADAADSLMVLKKMVFEQEAVTLERFRNILLENFKNDELFRQRCINHVPKYGNDVDEVDAIARDVAALYCRQITRGTAPRGGIYRAGLYCLSSTTPIGRPPAALPSG